MSNLLHVWESQGYKELVESILDGIRVEIFKGQALITQGSGAYWQLLIPSVGVIQINLINIDGTLGIYSAPQHKTSELLKDQEPNLENIKGILPVKCQKSDLPNVLAGEISKLIHGSKYDKPLTNSGLGASPNYVPSTSVVASQKTSGIGWWLVGGTLGIVIVCGCLILILLFIFLQSQ